VAITRWLRLPPRDTLKLFGTAVTALESMGVKMPGEHLALIRSWDTATLLIKRNPFPEQELRAVRTFAAENGFDLAYLPDMKEAEANRFHIWDAPHLYLGASALLGTEREHFLRAYPFYIRPAWDERPYFSHFFKWEMLPTFLSLRGRGGTALIEWGYLILWGALLQAALASAVLILLPLRRLKGVAAPRGEKVRVAAYFFALGLAFLFLEIAFMQKFTLFLGHPLYAAAVVLAAFLFLAGLGSGAYKRFAAWCDQKQKPPLRIAVLGIAAITVLYLILLPPFFARMIALPALLKVALSVFLIAPMAFLMGIPFPWGLSRVADSVPALIPWAWGINGCASVLSAILATLLAIHFGFTGVILLALLLYLFAAIVFDPLASEFVKKDV